MTSLRAGAAFLLLGHLAGCADQVVGWPGPDVTAPTVSATTPANDAIDVALNAPVSATFSEAMDPTTVSTDSFTVRDGTTPVAGTVVYAGVTAVFTPTQPLLLDTTYSAVVTTQAKDLAGNPLPHTYSWSFTTGAVIDATAPMILLTLPGDMDTDVVLNTAVSATFSEVMDPLSITATVFTLANAAGPVLGNVAQVDATATFVPDNLLTLNTLYTATVTTGASDLDGNTLTEDYVWTFTTGAELDSDPPTVTSNAPEDMAIDVPVNTTVNATFSEDMDPLSIDTASFTLVGPGDSEVLGTVHYDPLARIGTFIPASALMPVTEYTATVTMDAADLAGTMMVEDYVWTFSTGDDLALGFAPLAINLGSLSTFVAVAGSGLTNSNSSGTTTLNGDVGLSPTGTCLGDGSPCTLTNPVINGTLYVNDPEGVAAKAKVDLVAAYVEAMSRPPGITSQDLAGMTLTPGVYTSASTMTIAVGGTVWLDGMGDSNAVFIFQIGSSLTVNNDAQIVLLNGAKAKNVFWACGASSTLGSNVRFQGSILAQESNSVGTDSVVVGRLLCTTGEITLLSNTITLP
jgi:hypothetical protein